MRILGISDLHGYLPEIESCDILLIAGDVCPVWNHALAFQAQWLKNEFTEWLEKIPAKHIVGIAGNHDFVLAQNPAFGDDFPWTYLHDTSIEIEGIKIHGSPWTPRFGQWALMKEDSALTEVWDKIPLDTDILMVHGPMYGYGDVVAGYSLTKRGWEASTHVGSSTLRWRFEMSEQLDNVKAFVFGHIHEGHGMYPVNSQLIAYNVSQMNDVYEPVNSPIGIRWKA